MGSRRILWDVTGKEKKPVEYMKCQEKYVFPETNKKLAEKKGMWKEDINILWSMVSIMKC